METVKKGEAQFLVSSKHLSSIEVLWRTLIADRLENDYPTPFWGGLAFGDFMNVFLQTCRAIGIAKVRRAIRSAWNCPSRREPVVYLDLPELEDTKKTFDAAFSDQGEKVIFMSSSIQFLHDSSRLHLLWDPGSKFYDEFIKNDRYFEYNKEMLHHMSYRCLFQTEDRLLGSEPVSLDVGDKV
ncbi:hypothetical protein W97_06826 [Coniosporium apollinis CBS 100218]|uniref:Uncharacterized protein n=1 Tax=Coniosporium apollinis (strain CBS 100218) TaxID=1168221 RepID=R7Z0T2_CONA1|nr:uncharacterized protein W97_06826 [Coniosporium apollinis CBS 100218]EON67683.1 hypothetical protein W97_06826 [Coniosporium apollinis CBS 100218]